MGAIRIVSFSTLSSRRARGRGRFLQQSDCLLVSHRRVQGANAEKNLQNARALFESHLQSVFTQRGPGWVDTALGDVCGFVRGPFGGSLKKSIFVRDGYAVYEQQHAIYDQFDDVRYFIDETKFKEMKRFELLPADISETYSVLNSDHSRIL